MKKHFIPSLLATLAVLFVACGTGHKPEAPASKEPIPTPTPSPQPAVEAARKNDVIFAQSFQNVTAEALQKNWKPLDGSFAGTLTGDGILFDVPASPKPGNAKIIRPLPVEKIQGTTLLITAEVKAENVSPKPNPWNGIKLLLQISSNGEDMFYPQAKQETGTFDWTPVKFISTIPPDTKSVGLALGLEQVSGKVWFRNLKVTVLESGGEPWNFQRPEGPVQKGHPLPALRGAMVPTKISDESLRVLGQEWNANLIRWQLGQLDYMKDGLGTTDFDRILDEELARMDHILPLCRQYGMYVVIDLHSLSQKQFASPANQEKLINIWKMLAARYKDNPVIWGYDIANEPRYDVWGDDVLLWNDLSERVAMEIRKIDPVKPVIIEPVPMASPEGFLTLRPANVPNVIYSVHMYNPGALTHNKVWDKNQPTETYPGKISGQLWDREHLEKNLAPVIEFQKKYNVQIYVGEFGCIRWSPGRAQYLSNLIEIFEKYGWDWSYHAFREWNGWSVEHGSDPQEPNASPEPTDAGKVIRSWFDKNKKPDWTGTP